MASGAKPYDQELLGVAIKAASRRLLGDGSLFLRVVADPEALKVLSWYMLSGYPMADINQSLEGLSTDTSPDELVPRELAETPFFNTFSIHTIEFNLRWAVARNLSYALDYCVQTSAEQDGWHYNHFFASRLATGLLDINQLRDFAQAYALRCT